MMDFSDYNPIPPTMRKQRAENGKLILEYNLEPTKSEPATKGELLETEKWTFQQLEYLMYSQKNAFNLAYQASIIAVIDIAAIVVVLIIAIFT